MLADTCIVEYNVDVAGLLHDLSQSCVNIGFLGNVSAYKVALSAFCSDLLNGLICIASCDDHNLSACLCQTLCNHLADAAAAAGYDCNFSG